jgi:hypothetical protein
MSVPGVLRELGARLEERDEGMLWEASVRERPGTSRIEGGEMERLFGARQ